MSGEVIDLFTRRALTPKETEGKRRGPENQNESPIHSIGVVRDHTEAILKGGFIDRAYEEGLEFDGDYAERIVEFTNKIRGNTCRLHEALAAFDFLRHKTPEEVRIYVMSITEGSLETQIPILNMINSVIKQFIRTEEMILCLEQIDQLQLKNMEKVILNFQGKSELVISSTEATNDCSLEDCIGIINETTMNNMQTHPTYFSAIFDRLHNLLFIK